MRKIRSYSVKLIIFALLTLVGTHEGSASIYTCGCLGLRHCWDWACTKLYNASCEHLAVYEEQQALLYCTQNQSLMCCTAGQWMGMYGCPVMWTTRYSMGDPQECGTGTLSETGKASSKHTKTSKKE